MTVNDYGTFQNSFRKYRLSDLCVPKSGIQTGPFGSQLHKDDYVEEGTPIITVEHLGDNKIIHEDLPRVSEADKERLSRYILKEGDIVFSRVGAVDRRAIVSKEEDGWLFSGRCLRVRPDNQVVSSSYLSWYFGLPAFRYYMNSIAFGATMPTLNTKLLSDVPIFLPDRNEQNRIASLLNAIAAKIELNRRMNETLEAMSRAIFKSWFVDFDPVLAKVEGRQPIGMSPQIADLFPDDLIQSELGPIPTGWETRSLDEIARFVNGLALQKYPPTDGQGLPVIKIAQLRAGHTVGADLASGDLDPDYVVDDGDVLFSWSGSLECVLWAGGRGALNQHLFKVTSNEYPKWFYYLSIHLHLNDFRQIAAGKATTMGHIQRHHLSDAKVAVPPLQNLQALNSIIEPFIESIWRNSIQSRALSSLRDALLPKLVSGELRVRVNAHNEQMTKIAHG